MRHNTLLTALAALAVLGLSACASTPADPAPAAAAAATPPAPQAASADGAKSGEVASADDPNKLVCYDEIPTGTHIRRPVRVCATAAEWERRREEDQKAIKAMGRRTPKNTGG